MILLGLTGSIGMGKSTTSEMFRAAGVPVYDADAAVHRLYRGDAVAPIAAVFPDSIVDNRVDRAVLSRIVLEDAGVLKKLEGVVHPLVAADRARFLAKCASSGARACVLDIPLLFETGGDRAADVVVVVSADPLQQRERVLARPEMSPEKYAAILAKQLPDKEKRRRAHFVVDTGRGVAYAQRQVAALLNALNL